MQMPEVIAGSTLLQTIDTFALNNHDVSNDGVMMSPEFPNIGRC